MGDLANLIFARSAPALFEDAKKAAKIFCEIIRARCMMPISEKTAAFLMCAGEGPDVAEQKDR